MGSEWCSMFAFVFFLKIPRPPRSTRTYTLCPTRRSSDLQRQDRPGRRRAGRGVQAQAGERARHPRDRRGGVGKNRRGGGIGRRTIISITLRSEEHTSELQSLMRISYAVFCLKKQKEQHSHENLNNIEYIQHLHHT